MAAEVEVQSAEVGRSGGRLHLSPLTDSNNKNLLEVSALNQSRLISPEPSKPAPGPKPRLTPKPFTVERNPTIKPILAPKPQPKPRPESTRLVGYKPDLPSTPKPPTPLSSSKPKPVTTNSPRPASTSFRSPKLNVGQTTKPVAQPFKPAPPLAGDPSKPISPTPKPSNLTYSRSLKRPPSAEWSGSTKTEERDLESPSKVGPSITRAKSMGHLLQIGQEEDEKKKLEAAVPLRAQPRGIRPRPVSAIYPTSPTKAESPNTAFPRAGRRPLSTDLTSKFESAGLSLHHKPSTTKENSPENSSQKKEPVKLASSQISNAVTNKPASSDQSKDSVSTKDNEDVRGASIKSRISLLLDSSASPVTPAVGQAPDNTPTQTAPEAEPAVGVKQLIKQLTVDQTSPNQSPVLKPALKPRPLPLDLTKRFSPDPTVSLGDASDRHDAVKAPERRGEDSIRTPSDEKIFVDLKDSPHQIKTPVSEGPDLLLSPKGSEAHMVRASVFENVVEKHSILMVDESKCGKLILDKPDEEGKLVTATYKEPVSPSGPVRVVHSYDTVPSAEGSTAVSESVPSAQREDKAMTLRMRRSEGTKTTPEKTSPEQISNRPRYLRVGALPKWTMDDDIDLETEMPKDKPRDFEVEDGSAAAAKRLKTQQMEEQAKPRATYFALTGQLQETVTATSEAGDTLALSDPNAQWSSQGKVLSFRRNPSLDEALANAPDSNAHIEAQREKQKQLELDRQAELEFARLKEREMQREFERQRQKEFENEKQAFEDKQRALEINKQIELEKLKHLEFEKQRQVELRRQRQMEMERQKQPEINRQRQNDLEWQNQTEAERQKQAELDKQRQIELEKQRQLEVKKRKQELERQKQLEMERQKQVEIERQRQHEVERQKQIEAERLRQIELEKQCQIELENQRQLELKKCKQEIERQKLLEMERQKEIEAEKQRQLELKKQKQEIERQKQLEMERQKEIEIERQRQQELERQKQIEAEQLRQIDLENQRQLELKKRKQELERQKQLEIERQKQLEAERQRQIEIQRQKQLEAEKQRQMELERQRQMELDRQAEIERQKQTEFEKQWQKEQEKQKQIEAERLKQKEIERQKQIELERQIQLELERQKQQETEKAKQLELEKERQRQLERDRREMERQRQREEERRQKELDKERKLLEKQKERQRVQAEAEEQERRQQAEFQKQKVEMERQRLREKMEKEQAEKLRQMALEQEMLRMRELDKERERQKEMEREKQRELELQRQRELEKQRQKQLDLERQELEKQRLRQQEHEKERQRREELERRQLLDFEKQKQAAERQQILEMEKHRLRMEREEAERMRQVAKQQEAERQRLKDKQKKEEQERIRLESAALRPKVVDLDSVLRNDQSKGSSRGDPSTRWKEPLPKSEQSLRPGILDIDSFTSYSQPSPTRDLFPVVGIQEVNPRVPVNSGGFQNPGLNTSQDPWELRSVEMSVDNPEQPRKPMSKTSPEQLLLRQEERRQVPQRRWSGLVVDDPFHMGPFSGPETKPAPSAPVASSSVPTEQLWLPRDHPQAQSRSDGPSHRRTQGSQELNRLRSRSMSRRSAPSSSALESSLSRMRSRSAHRDQARDSWVQQKQNVSTEDDSKDSETPVHETDSQYGTWETGLRSEDSLTPATPSSDSNHSPSPKKLTSPQTLIDPTTQLTTDATDVCQPPAPSSEPLPFPDAPVTLLDNSALRSRAQLGKKRAPRTRPSRAAKVTQAEGGASDDWIFKDSTEEKVEKEDSDSEEQPKVSDSVPTAAPSQPQRVALFPGMDPSALMAQLKKRGESDQTDGPTPAPTQLSHSPKSPFLPRATRVLPPPGGKENGEEDSPQWLKELKSKKRLSQYENES